MRSSAIIVAGVFAMAAQAQDTTASDLPTAIPTLPSAVSDAGAAASSVAAEIDRCLSSCGDDNLACKAACVPVPSPNEDDIAELNRCSRDCDQGDGSPEDTEAYGQCLARCSQEHYFSAGASAPTAPAPTGTDAAGETATEGATGSETTTVTSVNDSATGTATETETETDSTGTATGDADSAEETGEDNEEAAAAPLLAGSAFGLVGLVAAFFL